MSTPEPRFKVTSWHDRPCPTCSAGPGQPCAMNAESYYTDGWIHAARRGGPKKRKVPGTIKTMTRVSMVHCPRCQAKPGEACKTRTGGTLAHGWHQPRLARYRAALRAVVPAADCTARAMVAGNERKFSRVLMQGQPRLWVGFGWVEDGPLKFDDDLLPRVIEPVYFMETNPAALDKVAPGFTPNVRPKK